MKCLECGREFINLGALSSHISQVHIITPNEYYDKYLKKDKNDGTCKNLKCRNQTKFLGLSIGYKKFCCTKCKNSDPDIQKQKILKPKNKYNKPLKIETNILCSFGCEKVGRYKLKNGKFCCENKIQKCDGFKKNIKYKKENYIEIDDDNIICSFGCGKKANYKMNNGKFCCNIRSEKCEGYLNLLSITHKNQIPWIKGKKASKETLEKQSLSAMGHEVTTETKIKISLKNTGNKCSDKLKEINRQRLLNGGAAYILSFIKNPSKPQVELFNRIKKLYPNSILNYPCYPLNFSLDVAIPELMICFESDGSYWHQDKDKDLKRQKQIEDLGWRMIRYYPIDSLKQVPQIKQIIKDIENIIGV
jgi:hypothetical protein